MPIHASQRLRRWLEEAVKREGRKDTEDRICDWLETLFDLSQAGMDVARLYVSLEIACQKAGFDMKELEKRMREDLSRG